MLCKRKSARANTDVILVDVSKFLRTPILKKISERLLLKITLCDKFTEGRSFLNFTILWRNDFVMYKHVMPRFPWYCYFITHIKWDVIISSSLRLLLIEWIWYRCQNRIENYHHHDGEQLGFYKKVHNTEQVIFIARNEEFQFIWKKLYSRDRKMPYSRRKLT